MQGKRPNILYVHSHDTGRYVQPYGHAIPTPNIQRLAQEGVLFRKAFCTAPTCSPSRASLLTGQHPHSNGMFGLAHRGFALNDYSQHIVHTLRKEAGYYTALIGEEHIAKDFSTIGYDTVVPGSLVFSQPDHRVDLHDYANWWSYVPGANWRHPEGPESSLVGRERHPVVHIAYEDAVAYAHWAGKTLPTEAQWEYAARGGLEGMTYTWGDEFAPSGISMANTWQGEFPWQNLKADGYAGTVPVGSFPPNGYGLYDMAGNVWEWTTGWYRDRHPARAAKPCCVPRNPESASKEQSYDLMQPYNLLPRKVLKGGSYLCARNYCQRYRPAARIPASIDTSTTHIGFRCIVRMTDEPSRE